MEMDLLSQDVHPLVKIVAVVLAIGVGIVLIRYLLIPICKGIVWLVRQVFRFVVGEISDCFRIIGAIITSIFLAFLCVANIVIGRWSASAHFGRGVANEFKTMGAAGYRIVVGHPARLLCLTSLTEGLENRLPQMMADAPTSDIPSRRTGQFDGYKIVGSIAAGGSGGKLFIAEPDAVKLAAFTRNGINDARQVVIKSFSLKDGSSLPQIVRESRSLDAAKKLGLILDHELTGDRFYYVMRYVPGQPLSQVTKQLHAQSGANGLTGSNLRSGMTYIADLVATLETYHRGGLWHKDVKPDNIIVDGARAHLVDFGLITPLRSSMTLTTHGTEYFRDPEMVRLALKGVKVHEVDGTKFDIYGAGAVMFSVLEDSFPAHGVLSAFGKNSPEALRWIVRRAMSDYDKRYATAGEMLADLRYVMTAGDPGAVKPFELPSMRGESPESVGASEANAVNDGAGGRYRKVSPGVFVGGAFGIGENRGRAGVQIDPDGKPKIRVVNWWTGKSEVDSGAAKAASGDPWAMGAKVASDAMGVAAAGIAAAQDALGKVGAKRGSAWRPRAAGTAAEQLDRARARVQQAQERAKARFGRIRCGAGPRKYKNGVSGGVILAIGITAAAIVSSQSALHKRARSHATVVTADDANMTLPAVMDENIIVNAEGPGSGEVLSAEAVRAPEAPVFEHREAKGSAARAKKDEAATTDPTVEGKTALIINEILPPVDDETRDRLAHATSAMEKLGLKLIGNVPGRKVTDLSEDARRREDELMVEARRAQGTRPIDAAETRADLQKWLADDSSNPNLVVWIARAPEGEAKKPRLYVFSAEGSKDGLELAKRVQKALRPGR